MSKQGYAALAARRYKTFKKQKRRESLKKRVMAFLLRLVRAIAIVVKKAGLVKTRKVETVKVESIQEDDE